MKQFYENFPEFNNLEKEKKRFVNRLNQIFREVEENCSHEELLQLHVNCCFSTGEDIDIIRDRKRGYLTLKDIADNSYEKSLLIIIEIFKLYYR